MVPTKASRAASSAPQSDTKPGLLAASGTAPPVAQSPVASLLSVQRRRRPSSELPAIGGSDVAASAQVSRPSWSASLLPTAARPAGRHPVNLLPANLSLLSLSRLSSDCGI